MGPKFGAQKGNKLGSQLGPMSITKLSPNWACQMGPIHCINFLLSGFFVSPTETLRVKIMYQKIERATHYKSTELLSQVLKLPYVWGALSIGPICLSYFQTRFRLFKPWRRGFDCRPSSKYRYI